MKARHSFTEILLEPESDQSFSHIEKEYQESLIQGNIHNQQNQNKELTYWHKKT